MFKCSKNKCWYLCQLLVVVVVLVAAGCVPIKGQGERPLRFLWPASVDDAKLEYIKSYRSTTEVGSGKQGAFSEIVFGELPPQLLFQKPQAVAASTDGKVFVADTAAHKIHMLDFQRKKNGFLKDADGNDARFVLPMGLATDTQNVYVVDTTIQRAYVFTLAGTFVSAFELEGLERPTQIAVDERHNRIYVADSARHQIAVYDYSFNPQFVFGGRGIEAGQFNYPLDLDIDEHGDLYVLDSMNARVQVFKPDGTFVRAFGERGMAAGSFRIAKSLAVSPSGYIYVTDALAHRFVVFDKKGNYLLTLGGRNRGSDGQIVPGGFYMPHGIDVDEDDGIWVVDALNRTLHKFQYLNKAYLAKHPLRAEDVYRPEN